MSEQKYSLVTPELVEEFKKIVGKGVYTKNDIGDDYSHDEMPIYGKGFPDVLIDATCTEDISKILKLCYENNIVVVPRGAGTGLVGSGVATCGGVMIDMTKMNRIIEYDKENLAVRVEPGVLLG